MKRKTTSTRSMRQGKKPEGDSKYARKMKSGNQMYGPGCCAHRRKF